MYRIRHILDFFVSVRIELMESGNTVMICTLFVEYASYHLNFYDWL